MFQCSRDETVVKGDQVLTDGRRNAHLTLLSKAEEVLADGTSPVETKLLCVFVPVVYVLLPDKKRVSYDAMFSIGDIGEPGLRDDCDIYNLIY